jgi:hypothetical protein
VAIRSGLAAQCGLAESSTFGTYQTPTRFLEFVEESLEYQIERVESPGLRANNRVLRTDRYAPGQKRVEGSITLEPATKGFGLVLKHALGSASISTPSGATNARLHAHTLGDIYGTSLTVQVGRPDSSGTVQPFSFLGCRADTLSFTSSVDEILQCELGLVGQDMTTAEALAAATYPTTGSQAAYEQFYWTQGVISLAGSAVAVVTDFEMEINNNLKSDRYFLGGATMSEPILAGMTEITGTITVEFLNLTAYNRFVNNTQVAINARWTAATAIESTTFPYVEIDIPKARFDGPADPAVGGPDVLTQELPFKVLNDGTNAPVTINYMTSDTAS